MANIIRQVDEKVKPVRTALKQINVEQAAREAGVPASTLRYDLQKLEEALPQVLVNQKPGPKPQGPASTVSTLRPDPRKKPMCIRSVAGRSGRTGRIGR